MKEADEEEAEEEEEEERRRRGGGGGRERVRTCKEKGHAVLSQANSSATRRSTMR